MLIQENDLKIIIMDPDGAQLMVNKAEEVGKLLANNRLTTNQIRALFGEVRQIQGQWNIDMDENRKKALRRLILLKPKMRYRAKKEQSKIIEELVDILEPAVNFVITEKNPEQQNGNFQRFVDFFEAILAYHKAFGGR